MLEICDPDVVYFDPFVDHRVDGLAVLTFSYRSWSGEQESRWNCTEVYRRRADGAWRILQTHLSFTAAR